MNTPFDYETTGGWWCHRCQTYIPYGVDHRHDIATEPEPRIASGPTISITENLLPTLEEIRDLLKEMLETLKDWKRGGPRG